MSLASLRSLARIVDQQTAADFGVVRRSTSRLAGNCRASLRSYRTWGTLVGLHFRENELIQEHLDQALAR